MTDKVITDQKELNNIEYLQEKSQNTYSIILDTLRSFFSLIIIISSVLLLKNKELDGSLLLIIYMYHSRVIYLINDLTHIYENKKNIDLILDNINDILDNKDYPKEKFGTYHKKYFEGNIEFKNVSFKYDKLPVLKNINLKIESNTTIGFVGKSGAGKTTIFNLISKLYTTNSGEILIDNKNINDYTEDTIRGNISVITQEPYIFNMSIKENIKIVKPSLTDEELIEICKLAKLHDYIEKLPDKYDALFGENGVILSGGLKQRLAIARALVKKSEIILLDEATSSLDNELQENIMESIKSIKKEYTILIIANRLTTIMDCDKIVVVDNGQIVGYDAHENLIKNNDIYKRLYHKEITK